VKAYLFILLFVVVLAVPFGLRAIVTRHAEPEGAGKAAR